MSAARTWLALILRVVTALFAMSDVLTALALMSPESTLLRPCRAIALPPAMAKNRARQAMTVVGRGTLKPLSICIPLQSFETVEGISTPKQAGLPGPGGAPGPGEALPGPAS